MRKQPIVDHYNYVTYINNNNNNNNNIIIIIIMIMIMMMMIIIIIIIIITLSWLPGRGHLGWGRGTAGGYLQSFCERTFAQGRAGLARRVVGEPRAREGGPGPRRLPNEPKTNKYTYKYTYAYIYE